ncbi:hypothetical protein TNCV_1736801 [Trichonephila clavipes]|nr:hypothetical protein TNCV_1736801 [Trichonephila clavipes]
MLQWYFVWKKKNVPIDVTQFSKDAKERHNHPLNDDIFAEQLSGCYRFDENVLPIKLNFFVEIFRTSHLVVKTSTILTNPVRQVGLLYDRWRYHRSPTQPFKHGYRGEGNILQSPELVVSAVTAHKAFGLGWYLVAPGIAPRPSSLKSDALTTRAMITNFFIPELNNHDVQELWFQQDGATCHTARATIDLLKDTFGDRLISRFGPVNWPPRSCDLTPLDYFL